VRIRQALNVESGLNDGIALPAVLILASLAALNEETNSLAYWLRFVGLQLLGGPLIGMVVGYFGGRLVLRATQSGWMNAPFQRLSGLGLALLAFAGAESVGGNGFIAAFIAGLTLGNTARGVCDCLFQFGEAEGQLLTLLVFLIFGAVMVPAALAHAGAEALVYALLSLTLIRMLPVAVSLVGSGLRPASFVFIGWFGPRGLASILFVLVVLEAGQLESGPLLETVVVLTVLLSTLLHGISAYPLARRYGAHVELTGEAPEHEPVTELPVRVQHSDHASTA
jgi:NhaP-type Na+/H+ or K+/H+ antiporter